MANFVRVLLLQITSKFVKIPVFLLFFFASVHTASNLTVDRSVTRSQVTPTPSGSKHTLPAGEETGSIPEEMDHSVADSVVSDIGLDVAEDDSLAEVLTGDSLKKPSGKLEIFPCNL